MQSKIENPKSKITVVPPLVSVVIPTKNRPSFLKKAIETVQAQTFSDWELIVVVDGATDETKALLKELSGSEPRLRFVSQSASGGAQARNRGIELAQGKYVAFLDDDDQWLPKKLEKQISEFEQNPDAGLVTCRALCVDVTGKRFKEVPEYRGDVTPKAILDYGCIIQSLSAVMVRRSCFEKVGLFNTLYKVSNDYDFYLRLSGVFKIINVQEVLFHHVLHSNNMTTQFHAGLNDSLSILKVLLRRKENLSRLNVAKQDVQRAIKHHCTWYHNRAIAAAEAHHYSEAIQFLKVVLFHDPLIGKRIPWGRHKNVFYRTLRPYLALFYYWVMFKRNQITIN